MRDTERKVDQLRIDNTTIVFKRNFKGKVGEYNQNGRRMFNVKLDPELAEILHEDGWRVKEYRKNENEDPIYFLEVEVKYNHYDQYDSEIAKEMENRYNPKVYLVTDTNKALLDETSIGILDKAWIKYVNVKINPYPWVVGSKSGIKAYLSKMYVVIHDGNDDVIKEDPMDAPFADIPEGDIDLSQW